VNIGTFDPMDSDPQHFILQEKVLRCPHYPDEEVKWRRKIVPCMLLFTIASKPQRLISMLSNSSTTMTWLGNSTRPSSITRMGRPHIVKRMDRPRVRIIPEELGFGPLFCKELKDAAAELSGNQAALIMVGEPTLDKAFDKAVTRAAKTVKQTVDTTTDELAQELKGAVGS
jgi:hypothetical protein